MLLMFGSNGLALENKFITVILMRGWLGFSQVYPTILCWNVLLILVIYVADFALIFCQHFLLFDHRFCKKKPLVSSNVCCSYREPVVVAAAGLHELCA